VDAQLLDNIDALHSIESQWSALYEACPYAAPFQHPAWILPWWNAFGSGKVFTFAVWDGRRLLALLPAFLHEWEGQRQITLLGNGISDRLGPLAVPGHAEAAMPAILEALARRASEWDVCSFEDLPADCGSMWEHRELIGKTIPYHVCACRRLPDSADALQASLPHGLRRNLRRYLDKMRSAGQVQFRCAASEDEFETYLKALFRLHACRWNQRGEPGMLSGALRSFHRESALRLWRLGKARCFALRLDGAPIAAIYGFSDKQRFWSYQSGFDPAMMEYSPGSLILNFAMEQAIAEGNRIFDFLRGDERYKRDWGTEFECNRHMMMWHSKERAAE